MIAPQSTCKSIKHQVSILPHWFIPSLLPLHLVGTSNFDNWSLRKVGKSIIVVCPPHPCIVVSCCRRWVRASGSVFEANGKGCGGKVSTRESLLSLSGGGLVGCQSLVIPCCICRHHPSLLLLHVEERQGRWATSSIPHIEASSSSSSSLLSSSGGGIIVVHPLPYASLAILARCCCHRPSLCVVIIVVCPPPCIVW